MITPNVLSEKIEEIIVPFHKYNEKKNRHSLFCFVEGNNDSDYYLDKIRIIYGEDFELIICNNKKNVICIYSLLFDTDKTRYKLAFFIDRDFDEPINNSDIYETESYSIENYYCTEDSFVRLIKYEFKIEENDECFNALITFYREQFELFHKTVDLFNAFYSLIQKREKELKTSFDINLECKFPSIFATVEVDNCVKHYTVQSILKKYNINECIIDEDEIEKERQRLWKLNPFMSFRGKYEIEFYQKLLTYLINNANQKKGGEDNRIIKKKITANLNGKRFMSNLSQYAFIPQRLKDYLSRYDKTA